MAHRAHVNNAVHRRSTLGAEASGSAEEMHGLSKFDLMQFY